MFNILLILGLFCSFGYAYVAKSYYQSKSISTYETYPLHGWILVETDYSCGMNSWSTFENEQFHDKLVVHGSTYYPISTVISMNNTVFTFEFKRTHETRDFYLALDAAIERYHSGQGDFKLPTEKEELNESDSDASEENYQEDEENIDEERELEDEHRVNEQTNCGPDNTLFFFPLATYSSLFCTAVRILIITLALLLIYIISMSLKLFDCC